MDGWRRLGTAVATATLLLAWSGVPGLAGTVVNSTGSNTTAQVVWGTGDETGAGHYGGIYGDIESWGTLVGLWELDAVAVTCDAGTPDPSDDYQGMAGSMRNGDAEGSVTVAPDLGSAVVTGVLTITTVIFDDCAGTYEVTGTATDVPVELDLVAIGKKTSEGDMTHDLLAGVYNFHMNMCSGSREAAGTALLGGEPYPYDSGLISRNRWSTHENSH